MNIQTLHPAPAQLDPERLRPAPEVQDNAANAVTGAGEAPGITAAAKASGGEEGGIRGELRDRYAPEETAKGTGRYSMSRDKDGNPVLRFDSPEDAAKETPGAEKETPAEEEKAAEEKAAQRQAEEKETEKAESKATVTNTDRVDRELQQLREDAEDLARRLRTATGEDAEKLERQLTMTKIELRIKDNDTYRRAHAQVTREQL